MLSGVQKSMYENRTNRVRFCQPNFFEPRKVRHEGEKCVPIWKELLERRIDVDEMCLQAHID